MKFSLSRPWGVVAYAASWLPFFALCALALWQSRIAPSGFHAVLWSVSFSVPPVLVGGAVWSLARRLKWRQFGWFKTIAVELGLGIGFVVAWIGLFLGWLALAAGPEVVRLNIDQSLTWEVLMAALAVTIHSAVFHVWRILGERRANELAVAEAEALRSEAELQALRGQLDPHFLFNSLHSITALVRTDAQRAEEALLQFAGLLRRVLELKRDAADEVSLADEMRFVDDYLAIERMRLGERLELRRELSPAALASEVPVFSVQALVENAIKHGLGPRRAGGTIEIRAAVHGGRLELVVNDDGLGADPAGLARSTGVGLDGLRRRLELKHGADASLAIDTAPGRGFRATVTLPVRAAEWVESAGGSGV